MQRSSRRQRWLVFFVIAACLLAELLWRSGALNPLEQRLQDFWFQWQGQRGEARHVAIVAIDEDVLAAYPDDPPVFWTDRLAVAVVRLCAAGVRGRCRHAVQHQPRALARQAGRRAAAGRARLRSRLPRTGQ